MSGLSQPGRLQNGGAYLGGLYGTTGHELADGSTVTVDENYLRKSILKSSAQIVKGYQNVMPSYANLSEREVTALVEFMKEQSDKELSQE